MKIWFNQSYSMRNFVRRFLMDRPDIALSISAKSENAAVRDIAPEFWVEPGKGEVDYTQWLLDTAIARRIDVLVPQRGKADAIRERSRFEERGIGVHLTATAEVLELLNDKAAFAASMAGSPYLCPSYPVSSAAAFKDAVALVMADGRTACVKPSRGVFGAGYWTLAANSPFSHLADPDARRISPEAYAASLRTAEAQGEPIALLVMEHLPGLEASVDIVADQGSPLLAAVRTKLDARRQRIQTNHPLISPALALVRQFELHGAVNVQFKQDRHGEWRILEINARAAGGASYCDEVGIPFCATWLDLIAGQAIPFTGEVDAEVVTMTLAHPRPARLQAARTQSSPRPDCHIYYRSLTDKMVFRDSQLPES